MPMNSTLKKNVAANRRVSIAPTRSDPSDDSDVSSVSSGPTTRSKAKKPARSESEKRQASHYYNHKCVITGVRGPGTELAHIIPKDENDSWQNILPLRADLHREYDSSNPLWAFDPSTKQDSKRRGFSQYSLIHSDKGEYDTSSIKSYTGSYDIRNESHEFIVESYKRFIDSEYPEDIEDGTVGPPTRPYKSTDS